LPHITNNETFFSGKGTARYLLQRPEDIKKRSRKKRAGPENSVAGLLNRRRGIYAQYSYQLSGLFVELGRKNSRIDVDRSLLQGKEGNL
jgi:hypothetical protein